MQNLKFSFLYRDAANYKTYSEIIFANPEGLGLEMVREVLRSSCNIDRCFDPVLWNLPNIRTESYDPELDHDWYEFECLEETEAAPTDSRSLSAFLEVVQANPLKME